MILIIGCLAQITSDIYAPSLPAIAIDLQTKINYSQMSMAIYMYGMAISLLFYGPLSEGLGRKKPLLIGLMIMSIGTLICLFSPNIHTLILGRFIQGCGAGTCSALWRSIFRDVYTGTELAKYGSFLGIFITFIVPAAPTLGGYLQQFSGWRASFVFILVYIIITMSLIRFCFKETNLNHHRDKLKLNFIFDSFKQLLVSKVFMGYTLCVFICYGAFFAWFTTGPVLLIHNLGISPVLFGWLTLFGGGIATFSASFLNGRLVGRFGTEFMLRAGWLIMFIAGALMLILKLLFGMNLFIIFLPMIVFYFGVTFIWPNTFANAFAPFGKIAGYAGALYSFIQISGAAVIGTFMSHLPTNNQIPLGLVFLISPILAWLIFEKLINLKTSHK